MQCRCWNWQFSKPMRWGSQRALWIGWKNTCLGQGIMFTRQKAEKSWESSANIHVYNDIMIYTYITDIYIYIIYIDGLTTVRLSSEWSSACVIGCHISAFTSNQTWQLQFLAMVFSSKAEVVPDYPALWAEASQVFRTGQSVKGSSWVIF